MGKPKEAHLLMSLTTNAFVFDFAITSKCIKVILPMIQEGFFVQNSNLSRGI